LVVGQFQKSAQPRRIDIIFTGLSLLIAIATLSDPSRLGNTTTQLFLIIIVTAAHWVGSATSGLDYDAVTDRGAVWAVGAALSVLVFWSVALPFWALSRRRKPLIGVVVLLFLAAFYIGALFWLFPATDFP
jgi:carbon starvation protein CstA